MTSVDIPNSVTIIGLYVFARCSSLTSVTLPDSITIIDGYAFASCSSLNSITIPDTVTDIREGAFSGCSNLIEILVDANNSVYSSEDGVLFNKNKTVLVACPEAEPVAFTIPDGVTAIGNYCVLGPTAL